MKEESHEEEVGLLFYGSGTPIFWLGLLLFIDGSSRTAIFKILVRTLIRKKTTPKQPLLFFVQMKMILLYHAHVLLRTFSLVST